MERDICCFVLSVNVRNTQPFVDETCVNRMVFAEEPQPQLASSSAKPSAFIPFVERPEQQDAALAVGGSVGVVPAKAPVAEVDQICLDNVFAYDGMHKSLLPEMLRVQEWFER